MPQGRVLRVMQEQELAQKVAESKSMQGLLATRTVKEEAQLDLIVQQQRQEKAYHDQRMEHERQRRWEEQELHMAKLADLGVDIEDIRRRCHGTDVGTQTDE